MLNHNQLDGDTPIVHVRNPDIKLATSPHLAIMVPVGDKHDGSLFTCPKEHGGCGMMFKELRSARFPHLYPAVFAEAKENMNLPLNAVTVTLREYSKLSSIARQIMTKRALDMGVEYGLYMDDDTLPPIDGLFMQRNPEVGAVSGVYTTRTNPPEPLIYLDHGTGASWDFPMGNDAVPVPIMGAGAGFLLVRMSAVLDTIEKMKQDNGGVEVPIWADEWLPPKDIDRNYRITFGHDIRFTRKLNEYGHPVYVDGRVLCKHYDIESGELFEVPKDAPGFKWRELDKWKDHLEPVKTAPVKVESPKPSVDVIVVKYNQPEYEARTVKAVQAHTDYPNYNLTVHQNTVGRALSKCWNDLIRKSDAEYICLLNNDTVPAKGWLTKLMDAFTPEVGAVVPSSNIVFMSQIPTTLDRYESDFDKINQFASTLKEESKSDLPTLSGMCVVFRKADWEAIGGFNEDFFLYGEDTEFFWRLKTRLGKRLTWVMASYIHHYKAQSTSKAEVEEGMDLARIRKESERLVNELTDLNISHSGPGELPWEADTSSLCASSVVYSFGVGTNMDFEYNLIKRFGLTVHAFDPTPIAKKWVDQQKLPGWLEYHDYGVSNRTGMIKFVLPKDHGVSYTEFTDMDHKDVHEGEVRRFADIRKELGHEKVDIVKLDIEGSEFYVIPEIIEDGRTDQILVEFHDRFMENGAELKQTLIKMLTDAGYEQFWASKTGQEDGFKR
jgi:FkbM family methyltransferase